MTKQELNRDIKRLASFTKKYEAKEKFIQKDVDYIKAEFYRLHGADKEIEYMNLQSLKTLIVINRKYRVIQFAFTFIHAEL